MPAPRTTTAAGEAATTTTLVAAAAATLVAASADTKGRARLPTPAGARAPTMAGASAGARLHTPPRPAAPASVPWTGMVHAWPMPWRPHAPGAGILGPRPSEASPFAGMATHHGAAATPSPYGPPTVWHADATPPHPLYGAPAGGAPNNAAPVWD